MKSYMMKSRLCSKPLSRRLYLALCVSFLFVLCSTFTAKAVSSSNISITNFSLTSNGINFTISGRFPSTGPTVLPEFLQFTNPDSATATFLVLPPFGSESRGSFVSGCSTIGIDIGAGHDAILLSASIPSQNPFLANQTISGNLSASFINPSGPNPEAFFPENLSRLDVYWGRAAFTGNMFSWWRSGILLTSILFEKPAPPVPTTDVAFWSGVVDNDWFAVGAGNATNWASDQAGTPANAVPGTNATLTFGADNSTNQTDTQLDRSLTLKSVTVNSDTGINASGCATVLTVRDGYTINNATLTLAGRHVIAPDNDARIHAFDVKSTTGGIVIKEGALVEVTARNGAGAQAVGIRFPAGCATSTAWSNAGNFSITGGSGNGTHGGFAWGVYSDTVLSGGSNTGSLVMRGGDSSSGWGGEAVGVYGGTGVSGLTIGSEPMPPGPSPSLNVVSSSGPNGQILAIGGNGTGSGNLGGAGYGVLTYVGPISDLLNWGKIITRGGQGFDGAVGGAAYGILAQRGTGVLQDSTNEVGSLVEAIGGNGTGGGGDAMAIAAGSLISNLTQFGTLRASGGSGIGSSNGGIAWGMYSYESVQQVIAKLEDAAEIIASGGSGAQGGSAFGIEAVTGSITDVSLLGNMTVTGGQGNSLSGGRGYGIRSWGNQTGFSFNQTSSLTVSGGNGSTSGGVAYAIESQAGSLSNSTFAGGISAKGGNGGGAGGTGVGVTSRGPLSKSTFSGTVFAQGGNGETGVGADGWGVNASALEGVVFGVASSGNGSITGIGGNGTGGGTAFAIRTGPASDVSVYGNLTARGGSGSSGAGGAAYGFHAYSGISGLTVGSNASSASINTFGGDGPMSGGTSLGIHSVFGNMTGVALKGTIFSQGGNAQTGAGGSAWGMLMEYGSLSDFVMDAAGNNSITGIGGNGTTGGAGFAIQAASSVNASLSGNLTARGGRGTDGPGGAAYGFQGYGSLSNFSFNPNNTDVVTVTGGNGTSGGEAAAVNTTVGNIDGTIYGTIRVTGGSATGAGSGGEARGFSTVNGASAGFSTFAPEVTIQGGNSSGGTGGSAFGFRTAGTIEKLILGANTTFTVRGGSDLTGNSTSSGGWATGASTFFGNAINEFSNSGNFILTAGSGGQGGTAYGLRTTSVRTENSGNFTNSGTIAVTGGNGSATSGGTAFGFSLSQRFEVVENSGNVVVTSGTGVTSGGYASGGLVARMGSFVNTGNFTATGGNATGDAEDVYGGSASGFEWGSAGNFTNSAGAQIVARAGSGATEGGWAWGLYGGSVQSLLNQGLIAAHAGSATAAGGKGGSAYGVVLYSSLGAFSSTNGSILAVGGNGTGGGGGAAYALQLEDTGAAFSGNLSGNLTAIGGNDDGGGLGGNAFGFATSDAITSLTTNATIVATSGSNSSVSSASIVSTSEASTGPVQPFGVGILGSTIGTLVNEGSIQGSEFGIFEGSFGRGDDDRVATTGLVVSEELVDSVVTNRGDISGGIAAIVLGAGNKTLNLEGGSITGNITAGNGTNVINVKADTTVAGGITNFLTVNIFEDSILTTSATNALDARTALTVGDTDENTGGIFNLAGYSQTIATLNGAGNGEKRVVGLLSRGDTRIAPAGYTPVDFNILTISSGGAFNGTIEDGESMLGLNVTGGVLSLLGNNTYSAGTMISNRAVVEINSAEALGSGTKQFLGFDGLGGTLRLTRSAGNVSFAAGRDIQIGGCATATFDTNGERNTLTFAGNLVAGGRSDELTISESDDEELGRLSKTGEGTLVLTGTESRVRGLGVFEGRLAIESGGAVETQETIVSGGGGMGPRALLSRPAASNATLTVSGNGSRLTTEFLGVAEFGKGNVTVSNGGNLIVNSSTMVGGFPGSEGFIVVEGNGTVANLGNWVTLGMGGNGTLTVRDGAVVESGTAVLGSYPFLSGRLDVGYDDDDYFPESGGVGIANVTGAGSQWNVNGTLVVDGGGTGYLNITDGGVVRSFGGVIGGEFDVLGVAFVSGNNSRWDAADNIYVGSFGNGTLTVANGATVSAAEGEGDIVLGAGLGTLNIGNGTGAGRLDVARVVGGLSQVLKRSISDDPIIPLAPGILNFNHNEEELEFDTQIVGNVAVNQIGSGTTLLDDDVSYTGPTTITAGELRFGGDMKGLTGNISNASRLSFEQDFETSYSGVISGSGRLQKLGEGTLTLSGVNTYSGDTQVTDGTLVFNNDTSSLSGNLLNSAEVVFDQSADSSFSGVISGTGDVIKSGAGNLVLSGASTLSGTTVVQEGIVTFTGDTSGMTGDIVNESTVVFNPSDDTSFSGDIIGTGDLVKSGAALLALDGVVEAGETLVNQGTLWVQNSLTSSSVKIAAGATLGGIGVINGNLINDGILSPGNSPGTLVVNGNYVQGAGGVFDLEIASATLFDRLVVNGTASLAGTLRIIPFAGFSGLTVGQQIPFLTATGGVSGGFDTIDGSFVSGDIRGKLILVGGTLILVVSPADYASVANLVPLTQNQKNVARALNGFIGVSSGDKFTVTSALDILLPEQYPDALNAISPAQYESLANTSIEQANALSQILQQRFSSVRLTGARGFTQQGLKSPIVSDSGKSYTGKEVREKDILTPAPDNNWGAWVQGDGFFGDFTSLANIPNSRFTSGGVTAGLDYRFPVGLTVGVFSGYQGLYSKYANGGTMNINTVNFGLYAAYEHASGFYANLIVNGGYSAYQVKRPIQFSTINRAANSDPSGGLLSTTLDLGYDWKVGGFTITPTMAGQFTYVGIAPFTETGADSLDLRVNNQNAYSMRTSLGARVAYTFNISERVAFIPQVSMLWQHEFMQNARNIGAVLDGGAGPSFEYATATPGRDAVYGGVGFTLRVGETLGFNANYNIDFGRQDFFSNMVSGGLNFSF